MMRLALLLAVAGVARAQCTGGKTSKTTVVGYDYTNINEVDLAFAGSTFSVTGIKCAAGYATSTGGFDAVVTKCATDNSAYTVGGCLPCTSGMGLCTETSSLPNSVNGEQMYFQDTGVSSTEINWQAPNTGTYNAPILGYKIQMKQLCVGDVAGTLVSDASGGAVDYQQDAVYDCTGTYAAGDTEPVAVTAGVTSKGSWVDVTGVYTPVSGQNHDAECDASCATTACSAWADDDAILHTTTGCSGCAPRNPVTDSGCFPGAAGYPTTVQTLHDIGGLVSGKYYTFRVAAFNHFGTGAWSTQSYAVRLHTAPAAPKWAATPVTSVAAAGTGLTLNWAAGDSYGTGTDECANRGAVHTNTKAATLKCSRSKADMFGDCDTNTDGSLSDSEIAACDCVTSVASGATVTGTFSAALTLETGTARTLDYFNGWTIVTAVAGAGSAVVLTSSTADGTVLTTSPAIASTDSTTTYTLTPPSARTLDAAVYAIEPCTTAGYGAADTDSSTNSGTHTYTVQQCAGVGCTPTTTTYTTTSTTQAVSGLTAGTAYVFKVTATNAAGSTSSATTTYTTPAVPDKPDPPVALAIEEGEIKVSWRSSIDKIISTVAGHDTVGYTGNNGFILYAQSYDTATAAWIPAVRGSLTHDGEDTIAAQEYSLGRTASATNPNIAYASDSGSTVVDDYLQLAYFSSEYYTNAAGAETARPSSGTWNQRGLTNRVDVIDTVIVPSLLSGTQYRFRVALTNAVGTSALSDASLSYTTPDAVIESLRIYSGPPCVYKPGQGGVTTFAASSAGTSVTYRWELVAESNTGQSVIYGDNMPDPGGSTIGKCMDGSVCSVIEYQLPYPGDNSAAHSSYDQLKIRVVASNGRGIVAEELLFGYNTGNAAAGNQHVNSIDYCGCTDPGDDNYWSEATYMVPSLCTTDTFDSSDSSSVGSSNVHDGDWEYFQFFFDADSYAAEVTVRVDVGTVDVYVSTSEIPDSALPHTYAKSQQGVSNFYVADLSYANLVDSTQRSVFVGVKGASAFSRFQVMGRSSEFALAPGSASPEPASRERLQDITTAPAGITKTVVANGFNFFEMYYPHADNDIDLQIIVASTTPATTATISVYASLDERYPGPNRATDDSDGYWTGTGHFKEEISSSTTVSDGTLTFTIRPNSHSGRNGVLYIGVTGATPSGWVTGADLPSSTYTIKAKVYRYSIESSLLDPVVDATLAGVVPDTAYAGYFGGNLVLPTTASTVSDFYNGMVITAAGGDWNRDCVAPDGSTDCDTNDNGPAATCTAASDGSGNACTSIALDESRTITNYAADTRTITVDRAFSATVTTSVAFSMVLSGTDAAARTASAEDRYSVASADNFNYYEIITSDATRSLSLAVTVHYGSVSVYTSSTSLPTQDQTVSKLHATYSASPTAQTISVAASDTNIAGNFVYLGIFASGGGAASYDLVVTENTFGVAAPTQLYWCDEGTDVRSYTTSTVAVDAACTTLPGAIYPVCDDNGVSSTDECPLCTDERATLTAASTGDLVLDDNTFDINRRYISAVDGYFNNMVITIASGSWNSDAGDESRVITGYTGSTRTITVNAGFSADTTGGVWSINTGACQPDRDSTQEADTSTFRACKCSAGDTMGVEQQTTLSDNDGAGHFFALYVGSEDSAQQTSSRSGMGSLPATIDGDASGWGLDWTMPMTTTWIDSRTDEWDMDVDVSISRTGLSTIAGAGYRIFGSTRERYPSDERAYDTAVASAVVASGANSLYSQAGLLGKGFATTGDGSCTLLKAQSTEATYGACLAACDTLAGTQTGTLAEDANGVVSLPAGVATSDDYYAGWTIVTAAPAAVGTIVTSRKSGSADTTPIVTFSWLPQGSSVVAGGTTYSGSSTIPDVADGTTTYTLYPPSSPTTACNAAQFTTTGTVCQLFNCPADATLYLVADEATDQTYTKSSAAQSLVVPHYTFSSSWLYVNIENDEALSGHLQITKTEMTSTRSVSTDPIVAATQCTSAFCSYNGNCIDDSTDGEHKTPYCICSDGFTGDDCSIEAFSAATTIATSSNVLGSVATGYQYGSAKSGGGAACTDMTGIDHGCLRISNTFSAALTLKDGINHQTAADYYKGWNIVVSGDTFGEGVITASSTADPPVITVDWSTTPATTTTSTQYRMWTNVERGTMSAANTLMSSNLHSTAVDYYKGWTIETTANPAGGVGTITANTIAGVLTVTWTSLAGSTGSTTTYTLTPPTQCSTQNVWEANDVCSTGHSWNGASKTCTRYSGPYQHVWEPFVYIGVGHLQHCAPIENLVVPDATVANCKALCSPEPETGTMADATTLQASNGHSTAMNFYVGWTIVTGTPIGSGDPVTFTTGDAASRGVERGTITQSLDDLTITVSWDNGATPTLSGTTTYTLTPPPSVCNAFTHDATSGAEECKLYTCPTATAPVTTAAETKAGSWGVDATANKAAYHRAPLTCCAAADDWTVATHCTNPVRGYYDEVSCTTVQGVTTSAACEQVTAADKDACENAPATAVEDTCELKPYDEVPESLCSPEAIRNGYDGSTTAKSCDAFDVVKLDCATHKCTPSAAGANPYKIGFVKCTGGDCTINAAKPIVEIPYVVAGLPAHSKVLTYVDSQPYPAKGANSVLYRHNCEASDADCVAQGIHSKPTCTETASVSVAATRALCEAASGGTKAACEAIAGCTFAAGTTASAPFAESSVKIYDMAPLPTGKKHTLVMMLLTDEGEPLGTVLKQFQVGYAGGCTVAPDGSVCGGNGACHLGYCVCHDGYFGTTCDRSVDEDGSVCAAESSSSSADCLAADGDGAAPGFGQYNCVWDSASELCSIQIVTTGFTANGVYEARATSMAASKLGEARFLTTRMLEANAAAIDKSDNAGIVGTAGKLEAVTESVVATVAAAKSTRQTKVDALYAKTERNAIKVRQAKEESLRLQTSNLEAKLEMQRSLADHQTQVQNRFQSKRFDVYKLNALKQDKLKQEFARTRFTLNQLLTSNGPTVDPSQFKESTCTTDQFYNVICSESTVDRSASFSGTGYVSGQTVDAANTDGTRAAPVIAIEGENTVGQYDDVNRGR